MSLPSSAGLAGWLIRHTPTHPPPLAPHAIRPIGSFSCVAAAGAAARSLSKQRPGWEGNEQVCWMEDEWRDVDAEPTHKGRDPACHRRKGD